VLLVPFTMSFRNWMISLIDLETAIWVIIFLMFMGSGKSLQNPHNNKFFKCDNKRKLGNFPYLNKLGFPILHGF
jgi:hypothetical protein